MSGGPVRRDGGDLLVAVRLTPNAPRERIGGTFTDAHGQQWLQAAVGAPPDKGKANAALLVLLARRLKLPRSSIFLETGDTNRLKRLRIARCPSGTEGALAVMAAEDRNER